MIKQTDPKVIGAFVVGVVILIVVIFLVFGSQRFLEEEWRFVTYYDSSVSGLRVGAPVRLKGVDVGAVEKVSVLFDASDEFIVEVICKIYPDVVEDVTGESATVSRDEQLRYLTERGFRTRLASQSLVTGLLYIKLDYYEDKESLTKGLLPELPEIPSVPTSSEELTRNLESTLAKLDSIPIVEITTSLLSAIQGLDSLTQKREIVDALKSLKLTMDEMQDVLSKLDNRIEPVSDQILVTAEAAGRTLDETQQLVDKLNDVVASQDYELKVALQELAEASRAMRQLADYLQRNPSSIIFGK